MCPPYTFTFSNIIYVFNFNKDNISWCLAIKLINHDMQALDIQEEISLLKLLTLTKPQLFYNNYHLLVS